jgi:superfamily II DNA/RNA helicase
MRLVSVVRAKAVNLSTVEFVALDEADKLFEVNGNGNGAGAEPGDTAAPPMDDKQFLAQIDEVLGACTHARLQRALFSATMTPLVRELAVAVLREPILSITIGTENAGASTIEQRLVFTGREEGKLHAMHEVSRSSARGRREIIDREGGRISSAGATVVIDHRSPAIAHHRWEPRRSSQTLVRYSLHARMRG